MTLEGTDALGRDEQGKGLVRPRSGDTAEEVRLLGEIADEAGLTSIRMVAWRDLDDLEAGGSELHAHRIAEHWAAAGIDVEIHTSRVTGSPEVIRRSGYRSIRRSGRYGVFPRIAGSGLLARQKPGEGLVEIWNGMPFLSPLWYRGPKIVFLHHVHAEMWKMVLPPSLARMGETFEAKIAPPFYRKSRVVTLSTSSKEEIVGVMGLPADNVTVVPPGIDHRFVPGGMRSSTPVVVAVGRLVPVKRFDLLFRALAPLKEKHPGLRAVIVGEGYTRRPLEDLRRDLGAEDWISMPGRLSDEDVLSWYQTAWVVASSSLREGWGMTLTEAGACGTPAVATDIAGHRDAILDDHSGLLVSNVEEMEGALDRILGDENLRARLSRGAIERSRWFTWDATARTTLEALADESKGAPH